MSAHEKRYVVVDRLGQVSNALTLDGAEKLAEKYDDYCPEDKPHTIHELGPAVPR